MKPRRTVLIVDDDPYILGLLTALLTRFDFEILTARGPLHALKIANDPKVLLDLVITDIHMPEMNGVDLVRKLHQRRPKLKAIYISEDPEAQNLFLLADQPSPILKMPFSVQQLENTVKPLLTEAAREEALEEAQRCPRCDSKQVRRSQRRFYDWMILPFVEPYRCRSCRRRLFRLRVFGKLIGI